MQAVFAVELVFNKQFFEEASFERFCHLFQVGMQA